jgi:hypothetical protein
MLKVSTIIALGDETESECPCCGRKIYEGEGLLLVSEREIAHYGYRWTCGNEARFKLGVCALNSAGDPVAGLVVLSAFSTGESLIYKVIEPPESPWGDTEILGKVLTRRAVLEDKVVPEIFELVDVIAAKEPRIYERVLAEHES